MKISSDNHLRAILNYSKIKNRSSGREHNFKSLRQEMNVWKIVSAELYYCSLAYFPWDCDRLLEDWRDKQVQENCFISEPVWRTGRVKFLIIWNFLISLLMKLSPSMIWKCVPYSYTKWKTGKRAVITCKFKV